MRGTPIRRGFTLIELMITVAICAVLLALAAPSFKTYTAKKKVEGTLAELATDLQLARSEAVSRNASVRLTLGTNCYAIALATAAVDSACAVTPLASRVRSVTVEDTTTVSLTPEGALTYINFDSVRGESSFGGLASTETEAAINVKSTASVSSAFNLRARVSKFGRAQVCTTNAVAGYSSC
jgi:type IV fimbrial biogenesis protein FimT